MEGVFEALGLTVLERGWLSSNNILFHATAMAPATVVDTGYSQHGAQTVALLAQQLDGGDLARIVNTHLHSDHCGGNAAVQARWHCEIWVPQPSFDAVNPWDESRLSYQDTGQHCPPFVATRSVAAGDRIDLGWAAWDVVSAPGHDPDALMLYQAQSRVLITGDALWERRLPIIFPELDGESGFTAARSTLDLIESLSPAIVIPGHGAPFTGVAEALSFSRQRLAQFEADPARHLSYAGRALAMFHMLEKRAEQEPALLDWLTYTPIFQRVALRSGGAAVTDLAAQLISRLLRDGILQREGSVIRIV
ncbi:MAG: MBL fold metallo-hydrolase [Rubrivivax sp.]|nr:MBL fold metallo-hydrolase [Rubrivivax sp.]